MKTRFIFIKAVIHGLCLLPLAFMYYWAIVDELGGDPVEAIIHFTGIGAFNLLLITLCMSPLSKWTKSRIWLDNRRLLGLYSFVYATFHLANFLFFEVQFNLSLFFEEIVKRPYITVGMLALILLTPLAITSINSIKKRMGKRWQQLHNFLYIIVILVAIHFYWSVKSEIIEPSIYMLLTLTLLWWRKQKIKRWFTNFS